MKMHANVRIVMKADGRTSVKVDGEEMAGAIPVDGLAVHVGTPGDPLDPPTVTLTLVAGDLDVVIQDAEVEISEPTGE